MPLPTLNALWRPNNTGPTPITRDDRELIRSYAGWPLSEGNLREITACMNRLAELSAGGVRQCQTWIDQSEDLEEAWADLVADGTAHIGNGGSYEGIAPGTTVTRDQQQSKLDVIEWDTSLLKVKIDTGGNPAATRGAVTAQRISVLRGRVLRALSLPMADAGSGGTSGMLVRS
jgi:hypothetical protein